MKTTGVIRRVDDLGRIIIPKSVRKELNIKEGEPMELFIDGNDVVFRKYTFDNCENETCKTAIVSNRALTVDQSGWNNRKVEVK